MKQLLTRFGLAILAILIFSGLLQKPIYANEDIPLITKDVKFEAVVEQILGEKKESILDTERTIQTLKVKIVTGKETGELLTIESGGLATASTQTYQKGDKIIISKIYQPDGTIDYIVLDYVRRDALIGLFVLFIAVALVVAGKKGMASLLGMAYSFLIIFKFVLPQISSGQNPIMVAIIGGTMIVPITFYISHGFNRKTHAAVFGTVIALFITGLLSHYSIEWAHLTGYASEDANFLEIVSNGSVNVKGLLLAGIIVGLFGILDDITISQAAIVQAIREESPHLSFAQLYMKSMKVGKDHIGSLINTLVLVYAGAALPFMLLITQNAESFMTTVNYEIIAEEIVRTLTASIGLILAVPITTLIAAKMKR